MKNWKAAATNWINRSENEFSKNDKPKEILTDEEVYRNRQ